MPAALSTSATEGPSYNEGRAFAQVAQIGDTLAEIFRRAEVKGQSTAEAADRLAEERLRTARKQSPSRAA